MSESFTHPSRLPVEDLLRQCRFRPGKRGGPGGQHRNKTESAMTVIHEPTGVEGQASERRSQADNRRNAVKRLRLRLAILVRSAADGAAAPSELWKSRCRDGKIACNAAHEDFPALLAEALDVIACRQGHLSSSAEQLGCTASQLMKLLAKEPDAWQRMNEIRHSHGLPPRSI